MREILLEQDQILSCIRASAFPAGVKEAFQAIEKLCKAKDQAACYGIFEKTDNGIIYRAAILKSQASKSADLEEFVITKGTYLCAEIKQWSDHIPEIGRTFDHLFSSRKADPASVSIEKYEGDDMICMIRAMD